MKALNNLKNLIKKPFPQEETYGETLWITSVICIFIVFFLYIFKPFGLHLLDSHNFLISLGFGIVAFVTSLIYEYIAVRVVKVKRGLTQFTFGKWILYIIGLILVISTANFIFVRLVIFDDFQWNLFPYMLRGTFAIGVFPIVFLGALALFKQEKKYQYIAEKINHNRNSTKVTNTTTSKQTVFEIPIEWIRYIEAMQNYINIGYIDYDGEFKEQTHRSTLKSIPNENFGDVIIKCHRSYLVNRVSIIAVSGNAQGLLLNLKDCEKQIPVSRSFVPKFKGQT